ncbi:RimJ/RimL family protein N-acetyltransferase [Actinoplanes octamycinicus]|uniref:RimJ/RimL family protein N-acetyltransferase n=1 Tax=Actinoplanes octamycinicus TaxID=135948 RepID=A0A7W7H7X1_9ACTN|nr:GNAT family N-acetyltransferase [Actinoplanes octamycinicus]MBB4745671.1 RimJ/RimL family protein N-acetyltransferase [Actinoplanes octamycinicus]GIE56515.1 N-acetyltransferase GCN5 [Actinoplanes octamycinicus]
MGEFVVAPASIDDMGLLAEWATAEGWNPGTGDERIFFPVDPGAFLVGRLDGHPITSISVVRYGAGHGFLGFYLTVPDHRGRGYGLRTWQTGLDRLAGRVIGLDGVVAQQDNYRKSGFQPAWTNLRFQGVPRLDPNTSGATLVDARGLSFADLAAYERRFVPADRDTFLALWISAPNHHALAALQDGALAGLAVRRPAAEGARIGPLYAATPEIAAQLLDALAHDEDDDRLSEIALDVPTINPAAVALAERAGLTPAFETARMYTTARPDIDVSGYYGVACLELG